MDELALGKNFKYGTSIEEEANVSKTALGGTTTKKKKYKV